ncbi:MAG: hypothetical protein MUP09_06120 [Thiovulaceae bacterium]|nr:hypothetical protein [Sulfurimonadaceae bacterium]
MIKSTKGILFVAVLGVSALFAAPGDLDLTFGAGGMVTTDFEGTNDFGQSVAIQDDGKIVLAGSSGVYNVNYGTEAPAFALARNEGDPTQRVDIDIIPNKSQNVIEYKINKGKCLNGKLKVAAFSTSNFNVTLVDPLSVKIGDPKLDGKANPITSKIKDLNHDGYNDFLFTFSICDLVNEEALNTDTTELILTGETSGSILVTGKDMVEIVQK